MQILTPVPLYSPLYVGHWPLLLSGSDNYNARKCFANTRGKLCFTQSVQEFIEIQAWLIASNLFPMVTQSINFYTFHFHILRVQMFEKCDSSNRQKWMVPSFSISARFKEKFELILVLRTVTHREKAPSNKTLTFSKSITMEIWVAGTLDQLFIRVP